MDAEQLLKRYAEGQRDFSRSDLRGVDLTGATLRGINLFRADLSGAVLERADLRDASFLKANLTRANLSFANLTRANLHRADLTATVMQSTILDAARFSDLTLPQGLPPVPPAARSPDPNPREPESRPHSLQDAKQRQLPSANPDRSPSRWPSVPRTGSPSITAIPLPSLALLWTGYCCFGSILGIHNISGVIWFGVWATALTWMLDESLAWFIPVLAAIAVMLGTGLSLWTVILATSVALGLGLGLLLLGWTLPKALKDSLWISGIVAILINMAMWLGQGPEESVGISREFSPVLLLLGMVSSGMGAIAWLQMQADGFRRHQIAWVFGGCAALGLLSGSMAVDLLLHL